MCENQRPSLLSSINWLSKLRYFCLSLTTIIAIIWVQAAQAQDNITSSANSGDWLPTIWMLVAASLVFFMNAGFAMLEVGFCRTRNATNVLAKNLVVFCVSALAFWIFGFGIMFGNSFVDPSLAGQAGFFFDLTFPNPDVFPSPFPNSFSKSGEAWSQVSFSAFFFFQLAFAGTAATIVSGAVAERIRFWAFVFFSFLLVAFSYPFTGHWIWHTNGWLANSLNFHDFAGSTVVHSVGGTAGLVGAWLLKPRNGRFGYDRSEDKFREDEVESFLPDNLSLVCLGCLILWLGWFGFNGGSAQNLVYVPHIITTTMISAATGGIGAIIFSPILIGKPRLASIINGILGGLVGITASSAYVDMQAAAFIGFISSFLVLIGESILEGLKIDDPVGAIPVHLFCGFWGTLAVGFFSSNQSAELGELSNRFTQSFNQLLGWLSVVSVTALFSIITWILIGIMIHYYNQLQEILSGRRLRTSNKHQEQNLVEWLIQHWQIGRNGIRVSEEDEVIGSDGVFYKS